ncbi:hypothetical protein BJY01DRAFT_250054 [Aspergillus pseudoustus]|uniref:Uncharacterized protein n=1 Tax=Aspergillus pseudoustus TaxID=1810923 RepID=A0ABR4JJU0_9EURO
MSPTDSSMPKVISWRFSAAPRKRSKYLTPSLNLYQPIDDTAAMEAARCRATNDAALERYLNPDVCEITTSLDPFLQFSRPMGPEDRSLLHSYLLHVPSRVYGTVLDSIFNPVRDISFPISLGSAQTMRWPLIAADGLFTSSRTRGDTQISLIRRNDQAYRMLNECLAQNNGVVSDDLLGGIIMATITKSRLLDPFASNAHLQGFEAAVRVRGGLEASLVQCSSRALGMAHVMPYSVCALLKYDGPVVDEARQLQQFVKGLQAGMGHLSFADFAAPGSPLAGLRSLKNSSCIKPTLSHTLLGFYLRPDERRLARFSDESPSYLALFLFKMTFYMVSEAGLSAELFLSRLVTVLEGSAAFDAKTGTPLLTEQGFMFVVLKSVQDFLQDYGLSSKYEAAPIVSGIDALKEFRALPSQRARRKARSILFYMLSGHVVHTESVLQDTYDSLPRKAS